MIKPNFKKLICTLALAIFIMLQGVNLVLAAGEGGAAADGSSAPSAASGTATPGASSQPPGSGGTENDTPVTPDQLFYNFTYKNADMKGTKIGAVNALPKTDWQTTLGYIVRTLLNISGGLTLLALTAGGTMMVLSGGKQEILNKGKQIVIFSVLGLIIISVSYALVVGVSEFQFFTPGTATGPGGSGSATTSTPNSNDAAAGGVAGGKTCTTPGC